MAVARKLAVIMCAMWMDGTCYFVDAAASACNRAARTARKDTAGCWALRHERKSDTFSAAARHADRRKLNDWFPFGGCGLMQARDDGTHVILPVVDTIAAPSDRSDCG